MKRQPTGEIFNKPYIWEANIQKIRNSYNSIAKKQTTQFKNGQRTSIDISPKIYKWQTGIRK